MLTTKLAAVLAVLLVNSTVGAAGLDEREATIRFCRAPAEQGLWAAKAERAEALVAAREVLPNPTLSVQHQRLFSGSDEYETVVGVSVPLGIGGRRWLLQDAAALRHSELLLDARADRMRAAIAFRRAFVQSALNRARLAVQLRQQARYQALIDTVRKLGKAGELARHDLVRLQTAAALQAALFAPLQARLEAGQAALSALVAAPVRLDAEPDQLAQRAGPIRLKPHPRAEARRAAALASAADARAERRRWVPDVTVFAGYRSLAGVAPTAAHGIALGLSLPLTFFDHGQGDAARADAEQSLANAEAGRIDRDTQARHAAAVAQLPALERSAQQLRKAIRQAEQLRHDTERLYLADEASLLAVLDAHQRLAALSLAQIDIAAAAAEARLALMAAKGRFDDGRLDAACGAAKP